MERSRFGAVARSADTPDDRVVAISAQWRALAYLAMAIVLTMTTWFSATAVIPQLREEWTLSDGSAAWLTIGVQLGFVVGALVSSLTNLPDVFSPRSLVALSALLAAGANLGVLAAEGPTLAVPLRFMTGAFLAGVYPPAVKLLATWFRAGRGTALGLLIGALTLGTASPHLVNALGGLEWRTVIWTTSSLTVLGAAFVLAFVREGPFPFPRATFDMRETGRVFKNRRVLLASLGYFGHMWELYAMWAWFIVFLRASLGNQTPENGSTAALATFAVIAIGAVGCWVGGVIGDRWGRTQATSLMMGISAACCLLIGFTFDGPTWLVVVVGLVWGFSVVADSAQFSAMVTEYADARYVGTALTLQLALGFTLTVVTIWLLPWLEDQISWRWAFAVLAVGPILGIGSMWRLRNDLADAPH
ncbi:MAG: MFS transporter [Actinomycetota bacterium]|nr:MFS transporter [Actinomycetota bacterium]